MKVVLQRVKSAHVDVDNKTVGKIAQGLLLLIGIARDSDQAKIKPMVDKILNLRIFENDAGKFHYSALDIKADILAVSQFTLLANYKKGRRPDFTNSAPPEMANAMYEEFVEELRKSQLKVETGIFAADMQVSLINDGPVTFVIEEDSI